MSKYKEYGITIWTKEDEGNHKETYCWPTEEEARKYFKQAKQDRNITFVELFGVTEDNTIEEI